MTLPLFPSHPTCTACALHAHTAPPRHVGTPTIYLPSSLSPHSTPTPPALILIGQNPGEAEALRNEPFIGPSGVTLRQLILTKTTPPLLSLASLYLTNAVRCWTPGNTDPTAKQKAACLPHTLSDILTILPLHPRCALLLLGGSACTALFKTPMSTILKSQGRPRPVMLTKKKPHPTFPLLPTFATYHPAYLLREPSAIRAVGDHLDVLIRWLHSTPASPTQPTSCPSQPITELCPC